MIAHTSKSAKIDITSIGGAAFDVFVRAPHTVTDCDGEQLLQYPLGAKVKIQEVVQSCGGGATNTSVGFSRLGLSAQFCGIFGDDEWGKGIQDTLHKEGVCTDAAIVVEGEISSFSIVLVDVKSGKRTILYSPNVNAHMCDPVFPKELLTQSRWIFLNHLTDVSCVILDDLYDIVSDPSVCLAWNPGGSQVREGYKAKTVCDLLKSTDILFLNAEEARTFMQKDNMHQILRTGIDAGVRIMCVTDGARGAFISDGTSELFCESSKDVSIVDTTGAGDAFATGVTWCVFHEFSLMDVLKAGIINATSVISKVGTQAGLLTETELRSRLKNSNLSVSSTPL